MRRLLCGLGCLVVLACVSPPPSTGPDVVLWRPPAAPSDPALLSIEPARVAVRVGELATLRVEGSRAHKARCTWQAGASQDPRLRIGPLSAPGVVDVVCRAGELSVNAQVTFTDAELHAMRDPYAGGVALFKLRQTPDDASSPVGRQSLGFPTLDALLRVLGAYAFPVFPFDRVGTLDRVGLDRWIVVDLPEDVNFYQAVALLRADPGVYPESYLPEDADFLRVRQVGAWPVALREPDPSRSSIREADPSTRPGCPLPRRLRGECVSSGQSPPVQVVAGKPSWDLESIGAPLAWQRGRGAGVGIAVVDTGVDVNHLSISPKIRTKLDETPGFDADGNGIPGDSAGVNFAHLAIAHGDREPRLALGLLSNVSDWDGSGESPRRQVSGHGTAIAALAAGAGGASGRLGVAPQAWILPVDIQENLRTTESRLLEEDPRMRPVPKQTANLSPLRSPVWALAAGVVYAVREGARVLSCGWPPLQPSWLLHDALLYAEDNCVLAVCAAKESASGPAASSHRYPARWRSSWLRTRQAGSGDVYDAWTGEVRRDFFERPLRALLMAGGSGADAVRLPGLEPDLLVPLRSPSGEAPIWSAASNPRNDTSPMPDRRTMVFSRPGAAAGLVAGAALLISAHRPDLEPFEVRSSLLDGAHAEHGAAVLWVPGALEAAEGQPEGSCTAQLEQRGQPRNVREPHWKRIKVRVKHRRPGQEPSVPATPAPWP